MADSSITKYAMAMALKELVQEKPLEKISISNICDRCGMNRKSFYYHFQDKYDLVNWIFDTEYANACDSAMQQAAEAHCDPYDHMEGLFRYLYENRAFYRAVLKVDGQNSFSSHFRCFVQPLLRLSVEDLPALDDVPDLVYDFAVDGLIASIMRWLMGKNCVSPEEFLYTQKKLILVFYYGVQQKIAAEPDWLA